MLPENSPLTNIPCAILRIINNSVERYPACSYVGRKAMAAVEIVIMIGVIRKANSRPYLSPQTPNISPPRGREANPAAKIP